MRMFVCADSFTPPTILAIKLIALFRSYYTPSRLYSADHTEHQPESTLFESENERQKIEPVPILLPRASRKLPDVKTRNDFFS